MAEFLVGRINLIIDPKWRFLQVFKEKVVNTHAAMPVLLELEWILKVKGKMGIGLHLWLGKMKFLFSASKPRSHLEFLTPVCFQKN